MQKPDVVGKEQAAEEVGLEPTQPGVADALAGRCITILPLLRVDTMPARGIVSSMLKAHDKLRVDFKRIYIFHYI